WVDARDDRERDRLGDEGEGDDESREHLADEQARGPERGEDGRVVPVPASVAAAARGQGHVLPPEGFGGFALGKRPRRRYPRAATSRHAGDVGARGPKRDECPPARSNPS